MSDDDFDTTGPHGEPDATILASVYLDGEATSDERALVETSPDALDEVRRLTDVRTVLANTAPSVSLSEREQHLASALDAWERLAGPERAGEATPAAGVDGAAAGALSTRRSARRRRTRRVSTDGFGASQWFLSAAAVLVVVAGGAAVVRGILADDATQSDVAFDAPIDDAPAGVEDNDALEAAEVQGENSNDDGLLPEDQIEGETFEDGRAESGLFDDSGDDAMEESADEADDAMSGAAESQSADADGSDATASDVPDDAQQPPPAAELDLTELETPGELAIFGSLVIPAIGESPTEAADIDAEPPLDSCEARLGVEEIAGFANYRGTTVTVGVDLDAGVVIAYVDDSDGDGVCDIVESTRLPDPDATTDS